jgi:hypothetical protein
MADTLIFVEIISQIPEKVAASSMEILTQKFWLYSIIHSHIGGFWLQ